MSRFTLCLALAALAVGCSVPDPDRTTELPPPEDLAPFGPLNAALGPSCGTLDCHGQPGRNLRLYDARGLRLSSTDISGEGSTTDAEILANERSFVGLEPAAMNLVLKEGGARPERLTIVRKARGVEHHKGGLVWPEGSDGDRCLLTWLTASTDVDACGRAEHASEAPQE